MQAIRILTVFLCACVSAPCFAALPKLKVSENKRFLVKDDGQPFFYLGDTAWELFHRLSREEADVYLTERAKQGFNVIQAVVLAEFDGLTKPNAYGHLPLKNNDPVQPIEEYFQHVDYIVNKAESLGMYVGMLPTWGDKVNKKWGIGPEIFTPENAAAFGEFLGKRYKDKPIIWINGGDRPAETDKHLAIFRALAAGLRKGDGGAHLITYHPMGGNTSAKWFHADEWLDFNMLQSGHGQRDGDTHGMITADYNRTPVKPCIDGEPNYENHPINWKPELGWFDAYDVRKTAYRSVFAGALGYTYGCHDIWQFRSDKIPPVSHSRTKWEEALKFPGATQMRHLRALMESRPFLTRIPDQSMITTGANKGAKQIAATRASDGSYALVYFPMRDMAAIDLGKLSGDRILGTWFDPRTGETRPAGEFKNKGAQQFMPPSKDDAPDWVLILDDADKGFNPPKK